MVVLFSSVLCHWRCMLLDPSHIFFLLVQRVIYLWDPCNMSCGRKRFSVTVHLQTNHICDPLKQRTLFPRMNIEHQLMQLVSLLKAKKGEPHSSYNLFVCSSADKWSKVQSPQFLTSCQMKTLPCLLIYGLEATLWLLWVIFLANIKKIYLCVHNTPKVKP